MSRASQIAVVRPTKKTGRKGGQKGNTNAVKSGIWANITRRNLDGRTALAKELQAAENGLIEAIGGKPTPQQRLLIARVVYKSFRCGLFETASINGASDDDHSAASDAYYLAWANSLRQDLQALGLDGLSEPTGAEERPLIRIEMVPSPNSRESTEPHKTASPPGEEPEPAEQEQSNSPSLIRVEMVPASTSAPSTDDSPRLSWDGTEESVAAPIGSRPSWGVS